MANNKNSQEAVLKSLDLRNWRNFFVGTFKKGDENLEESMRNSVNRFTRLVPKIKKSSKILVLSCGNTFLPIFLSTKYGCKVTVICEEEDTAGQMEKEILAYKQENITVLKKDFHLSGFDYNVFDMAWSVGCLGKRKDLMPVFREINRILTPQGRLILCELLSADDQVSESSDHALYSNNDIFTRAGRADLEKVYYKSMVKESISFYMHLQEAFEAFIKKKKNLPDAEEYSNSLKSVKLLYSLTKENILSWAFVQLQKRNA